MSHQTSVEPTLRQPLGLRELFCLMTLAALLLGLLLRAGLTPQERWLLGLTLGGSLLGIALARACQRRGWLIGIVAGTLGGLIAVGIIGREWLATYNGRARGGWSAADLAGYRNGCVAAAAVTIGLGILLALLGVACYQLLVWATDASEQGLVRTARRRPYRAGALGLVIVALVLSVINVEFLLAPRAWRPRVFIPQSRIENPVFISHGVMTVRTGSLSHDGKWLFVERFVTGVNHPETEKSLFRLDPQPQAVPFAKNPEKAEHVTFDCATNRLLFLEWVGESVENSGGGGFQLAAVPQPIFQLRIVDLDRQTSEVLSEPPPTIDPESVQWLPDGALVFHYGSTYYGREGHAKLEQGADGKWTRHESEVITTFDPHSGKVLEFGDLGMRIVDPATNRELESFSPEWVEKMTERLGGEPSNYCKLSPDGRFLMVGGRIYDRESRTFQHWQVEDGFPQPFFQGFSPRGHAVLVGSYNFVTWHPYNFLTDVPFGRQLWSWLVREPIRLIDPVTGREIARTRSQADEPGSIGFSRDGSRMAVFTDECVYVYDVPEGFR